MEYPSFGKNANLFLLTYKKTNIHVTEKASHRKNIYSRISFFKRIQTKIISTLFFSGEITKNFYFLLYICLYFLNYYNQEKTIKEFSCPPSFSHYKGEDVLVSNFWLFSIGGCEM